MSWRTADGKGSYENGLKARMTSVNQHDHMIDHGDYRPAFGERYVGHDVTCHPHVRMKNPIRDFGSHKFCPESYKTDFDRRRSKESRQIKHNRNLDALLMSLVGITTVVNIRCLSVSENCFSKVNGWFRIVRNPPLFNRRYA